jgi:hypothetical protein
MRDQTPLLAVAGMRVMKDIVIKSLDDGASTHRWAHTPVIGQAAALESSSLAHQSPTPLLARCGTEDSERERTKRRIVGARVHATWF